MGVWVLRQIQFGISCKLQIQEILTLLLVKQIIVEMESMSILSLGAHLLRWLKVAVHYQQITMSIVVFQQLPLSI